MLYVYRVLAVGIWLFFSSIALSKVGPVDNYDKAAACTNAPKSADNNDSREINASQVMANFGFIETTGRADETKRKQRQRRPPGRGSGVQ